MPPETILRRSSYYSSPRGPQGKLSGAHGLPEGFVAIVAGASSEKSLMPVSTRVIFSARSRPRMWNSSKLNVPPGKKRKRYVEGCGKDWPVKRLPQPLAPRYSPKYSPRVAGGARRSVSFDDDPVTAVWTRPWTLPEVSARSCCCCLNLLSPLRSVEPNFRIPRSFHQDIPRLFYSKEDKARFKIERRKNPEIVDEYNGEDDDDWTSGLDQELYIDGSLYNISSTELPMDASDNKYDVEVHDTAHLLEDERNTRPYSKEVTATANDHDNAIAPSPPLSKWLPATSSLPIPSSLLPCRDLADAATARSQAVGILA